MSDDDRKKWNSKFSDDSASWLRPSQVVTRLRSYLPPSGRAIDVAGGIGRHAIWLAQCGLDVTVVDISSVGLEIAIERSRFQGVQLNSLELDLQEEPFPAGPWDLILSHQFLWRPLFATFPSVLTAQGRLIVVQPTVNNLKRHPKPPRPFLLDRGELPNLVTGLKILHYEEDWQIEGRHEAVLVAVCE